MSQNSPGIKQLLKAILGAFIGVQSEQQRQQDFNTHSLLPYILTGLLAAAIFVMILVLIVYLVLN